MATLQKFNRLTKDLLDGTHKFGTDTFKVLLTNTVPVVTNTVIGNITQIAGGTGYTTGGLVLTLAAATSTGAVAKVVATDLVITATGAVGPFRYAVIYNDTATNDPLVGWIDLGQLTLANADTHTIDFNASNGIFTL